MHFLFSNVIFTCFYWSFSNIMSCNLCDKILFFVKLAYVYYHSKPLYTMNNENKNEFKILRVGRNVLVLQ